jgi:hypothetical protein
MMTSRSLICLLENQNRGKLQKIPLGNLISSEVYELLLLHSAGNNHYDVIRWGEVD